MMRWRDMLNHEYWPWWMIYLPVVPLYFWQALRMRRMAFFTNVNPAIDMGGFFGESKSGIYSLLPTGSYPTTVVVSKDLALAEALMRVRGAHIRYPLIVKPDVGERGQGVMVVGDEAALPAALDGRKGALLVQAMAEGDEEFGLMFARDPVTGRTELLSITGKRFLTVNGDGVSSVDQLLAGSFRGSRQRERLRAYATGILDHVPASSEKVRVEPIGNHCRGTLFINASDLRSKELEQVVDRLIGSTEGIYYGRMDVRSASAESLSAGRFTVIELNGVSSEPGHIYDPSWNIWRCWAELVRHVRHIGPISTKLLAQGVEPATLHALVLRCEAHFGWRLGAIRRITSFFSREPLDQTSLPRLRTGTTVTTSTPGQQS